MGVATGTLMATVQRIDLVRAIKQAAKAARHAYDPGWSKGRRIRLPGVVEIAADPAADMVRVTGIQGKGEMMVRVHCPGVIADRAVRMVDSANLSYLVGVFTSETVEMHAGRGELELRSGDDELALPELSTNSILALSDSEEYQPLFSLPRVDLAELVSSLGHCVAKDDTKPWLSHVHLQAGNGIQGTATDGMRVASWNGHGTIITSGHVLLRAFALQMAVELSVPGEMITFANSADYTRMSGQEFEVWAKIGVGQYPDVRRLVPDKYETTVIIDRQALIRALRPASVLTPDGSVRFNIENNGVRLKAGHPACGFFTRWLPGTVHGLSEPLPIAFNSRLLTRILESFRGGEVQLDVTGSRMPARFTCQDQPHLYYIVLPLITH